MQDLIGIGISIIMAMTVGVMMIYITNRSRCTLEQAAHLSGYSMSELQEIIREGLLTYRLKYFIFGPRSLSPDEIEVAHVAHVKLKELRVEHEANLRRIAEDAAARIAEQNRIYEERVRLHEEELEQMRRIHDEILKRMRAQLGLIPAHVIHALQVLDLPQDASLDEIRKRYRLLAKRYHPDTGGSQEQFIQVQTAYDSVVTWIESQGEFS